MWVEDAIEDPEPIPFTTTPSIALARLVLYRRAFDDRRTHGGVDRDGHHGASLARALGLPVIDHASDAYARFWGGPDSLVIEHELEGELATTVVGPAAAQVGSP